MQAQEEEKSVAQEPAIEETPEPLSATAEENMPPVDHAEEKPDGTRSSPGILWLLLLLLVAIAGLSLTPNPLQPRMQALCEQGWEMIKQGIGQHGAQSVAE